MYPVRSIIITVNEIMHLINAEHGVNYLIVARDIMFKR